MHPDGQPSANHDAQHSGQAHLFQPHELDILPRALRANTICQDVRESPDAAKGGKGGEEGRNRALKYVSTVTL